MIYIYVKPMCSACIKLKKELTDKGTEFTERDGDRLANLSEYDDIDKEVILQLAMEGKGVTNFEFPVMIDYQEGGDDLARYRDV